MFWLKDRGILGINARNLKYIRPYNSSKAIKLADDKIKTKYYLSARGIPVPKMFAVIRTHEALENFDFNVLPGSFVVKPNAGFGGKGIMPISGRYDNNFVKIGGQLVNEAQLKEHISDILDGRYSLASVEDIAFFEQLIVSDDALGDYSYGGLPDVRVVVHNLVPVMAMLRLPSKESKGKANLHMGAYGVGIDMARGEATYVLSKNKIIDEIPGVGPIRGLKIPYWDQILYIASQCQLITNLGYLAVDIAIDKVNGPVILELNARAGLSVQIANLAPLKKRLERIEGIKVKTPKKGVRVAKDLFGNVIEKEISSISGKTIIAPEEEVELIFKNHSYKVLSKVDFKYRRSVIDEDLADKLGLKKFKSYDPDKNTVRLKFYLGGKRLVTVCKIAKIDDDFEFVLGKRDLTDYLVDPKLKSVTSKLKVEGLPKRNINVVPVLNSKLSANFKWVDRKLNTITSEFGILSSLKPINLEQEKVKFFASKSYNPQFVYDDIDVDIIKLKEDLNSIILDDSTALGSIFEKKRREIICRLDLVEHIGTSDFEYFSSRVFPMPKEDTLKKAVSIIEDESKLKRSVKNNLEVEEVKEIFEKVLDDYGLENWKVRVRDEMLSKCSIGKTSTVYLRKDAMFSRERVEELIKHEIETHLLTAENGKLQPYRLFNTGLAGYLITQEGLAIYNQKHFIDDEAPHLRNIANIMLAVKMAQDHSFREVYEWLRINGSTENRSFNLALRVKRGLEDTSKGGAFSKDAVYFIGYEQVKEFVEGGGDLKDLYYGKYNLDDLDLIKKVENLVKPKYLPKFLK